MRYFLLFILSLSAYAVLGQENHTRWSFATQPDAKNAKKGDIITLSFTAQMDKHWHIFSQKEGFSVPTTFTFQKNNTFELVGGVEEPKPIEEKDETIKATLLYFVDKVTFKQKVKLLQDKVVVKGEIEYQQCDEKQCIAPVTQNFTFTLGNESKITETNKIDTTAQKTEKKDTVALNTTKKDTVQAKVVPVQTENTLRKQQGKDTGLLYFMLMAFVAGLAALVTPCVFPMIPMTVSYFTKSGGAGKALATLNKVKKQFEKGETDEATLKAAEQDYQEKAKIAKKKGRKDAVIYGISIILIYVLLGVITAVLFKSSDALNAFSTSATVNVIFFLMCVIFAISFFGAFEITLPARFTNFLDKKSEKSGLVGIFFMAFTLTVVSFSCTGPLVGTLLVEATQGSFLRPILGMAAFSAAFALPFTLFAMFPQWLNSLPKSGGWLNSVKVVLGFLELALGLKFLSQADLPAHWGLLNRDVFLSIWIGIFLLMGLYLLKYIQLPHDDDSKKLSVSRLILAIITFSFVAYLVPGLWGAPLKPLSGILPPLHTQDFISGQGGTHTATSSSRLAPELRKYGKILHAPTGFDVYFDLDEAIEVGKKEDKPVIIDFTGHGCANCRRNEENVWTNAEIKDILNNQMVLVSLYVDDKTKLPQEEQKDGITSIGKKWSVYETTIYKQNTQPLYAIIDHNRKDLIPPTGGLTTVQEFSAFLKAGLAQYKSQKK
jgi:thiol:disulfide interchange protein DsbD